MSSKPGRPSWRSSRPGLIKPVRNVLDPCLTAATEDLAGVCSKAAAQTIAEASDEEDEQPVPKRRRLRVREESDADEADGDGQGSQGSAAQEDVAAAEDREDEPVQTKPTQRRKNVHDLLALAASHSPMLSEAKPRPIFKGKAVEPVATEDEGTDSEMGNEQPQEGDRSQAIGE